MRSVAVERQTPAHKRVNPRPQRLRTWFNLIPVAELEKTRPKTIPFLDRFVTVEIRSGGGEPRYSVRFEGNHEMTVVVRHGVIFVWYGDELQRPDRPFPTLFAHPYESQYISSKPTIFENTHVMDFVENGSDNLHFGAVHLWERSRIYDHEVTEDTVTLKQDTEFRYGSCSSRRTVRLISKMLPKLVLTRSTSPGSSTESATAKSKCSFEGDSAAMRKRAKDGTSSRGSFDIPVSCVALGLLLLAGCGKQAAPPLEEIPMKQVSVEGINIRYVEEGEGAPIVLVHGIPTSSFLWRDMIGKLSAHGRVIAPDLPGFGLSDPPPDGDYSISGYARLLGAFLSALSIKGGTLVCHDFGGPISVTYALRNPESYDRLIIMDTFLGTDLPDWGLFPKLASIKPVGEILMWLGGNSIVRSGLELGVVDKARISEEVTQRYYMADGSPKKLNATYLGTLRAEYMNDLKFIEDNLKTIDKPTLIIWADTDAYLPISLGERIHEDIAGSKMEVLPNCGHFLQEDEPDKVTELIVHFLED